MTRTWIRPTTKWWECWVEYAVQSAKVERARLFMRKWAPGACAGRAATTTAPLRKELKLWSRVTKRELLTCGCGVRCRRNELKAYSDTKPVGGGFYGTKTLSNRSRVDVADAAADRAALLESVGSLAGASGGALRHQLAA